MLTRLLVSIGACVFAAHPQATAAQGARIDGRVHAQGDTSRVVPSAEVALVGDDRVTRTDSTGRFTFAGLHDGAYRVHVRRLGFEESELPVEIIGQKNRSLLVPLIANPQALSEVMVAGKRLIYPSRYQEAYARMTHEDGNFFTRERIDSLHPRDMQDLLMTIPGISVHNGALHFERCDDDKNPLAWGNSNNRAKVQVYIDDVRVTNYYSLGRESSDASHELRDIIPSSLQLMEVYRGVARIPGKYLNDACAVVLLWTK